MKQQEMNQYELTFSGLMTVRDNNQIARKFVEVRFHMFEAGIEEAAREGRKTLKSFTTKEADDLVLKSVTLKP